MANGRTKKDALKAAGLDAGAEQTQEVSTVVATIDATLVEAQIATLENQFGQLTKQLEQLTGEFEQKKAWALTTLEQLRGGILALRGLRESQTGPANPAE